MQAPATEQPPRPADAAAGTDGARGRGQRLIFANQLRGLAALSVMLVHLVGIFWAEPNVVSAATASPAPSQPVSALFPLIAHHWFNFGPFGVALFFLISGLVVPISLRHHSRLGFLAARLIRIYPTYLAALAIVLGVIWLNARYWNIPFPHDARTIIANALLLQNFQGLPGIDLVNWSLSVELKFYLAVALLAASIRAGNVAALFALSLGLVAANLVLRSTTFAEVASLWPGLTNVVLAESPYMSFMLIGIVFNYRLRGLVSAAGMAGAILGLSLLFVLCWVTSAFDAQYPIVTINYGYALLVFSLLFMLRHWARPFAPLDAMAAVSYPFYLIHSVMGYSLMRLLMITFGIGYVPALAIAVPVILLVATALHVTVERWTIAAGKRIG